MVAKNKNKAIEKLLKDVRKTQAASGRRWATAFPRDVLRQQQKSAESRVVKAYAQPTNSFKNAQDLLDAVEMEIQAKSAKSASKSDVSSTVRKPIATVKPASKPRGGSPSPVPAAPKARKGLVRVDSGIILNSSSSVTSVKGVHLHLATIPSDKIGSWTASWEELCRLSDNHIDVYFSTIETTTTSAGLIVFYADCENKLMANLLKGKLAGEKVLGKKLICEII
jgi:hypothetical protein